MKPFFAALLLALPLRAAAPSDEDLLKYVKDRKTALEKFTPDPVPMSVRVSTLCGASTFTPEQFKELLAKAPEDKNNVPSGWVKLLEDNPHGHAQAVTYGSPAAALAFFDPLGKFAEGSVLLKEKFDAEKVDQTLIYTGMLKREKGYNPDCGDWEFFVVDAPGTTLVQRGKISGCAACHEDYRSGDFVTREQVRVPVQISGGRIILHASQATPHGEKLVYEKSEKKNTLGFWTDSGDWASWTFDVTRPGRYEIHLWQGCGKGSGGSEVEVKCASQSARFKVEETGGFQNFKERVIGEIHVDQASQQTLEVHALSKPGTAVMDLPRVVLVPVTGP